MYKTIAEKGLEDGALEGIIKLFPQINKDQVKLELFSFASKFDVLKLLLTIGKDMDSSCNYCNYWHLSIVYTKDSGIQHTSWQGIW